MDKNTTNGPKGFYELPRIAWVVLLALVLSAYFSGLDLPFLGPDEPRYAQVAVEMFNRGDWVTPTLGGNNWFEKPVLLYWLEIVAFNIFGVSEMAARMGSAICGLGTIASLWILGDTIEIEGKTQGKWFALIAASSVGILGFSHGGSFDIIVTFPLTAAMVCYYLAEKRIASEGSFTIVPLVLFYVFVGFALLAKGLIGIVFPVAIIGIYSILTRRLPSRKFFVSLVWGLIITALIAGLWYIPMYLRHGYQFIDEFIVQHHFQRFTSNKYQHPQPFYFFWIVLPIMALPWLPFIAHELWKRIRVKFSVASKLSADSSQLFIFAVSWMIVPLVFFSFSGSKLPGYILPAVPAVATIAALSVVRFIQKGQAKAILSFGIGCTVLIASIALTIWFLPAFALTDSVKGLIASADARGFQGERVVGVFHISHSAEFYAAKRLIRNVDGRQPRIYTAQEVVSEMDKIGVEQILVIIPIEHEKQITGSPLLKSEVLANNTELTIVIVARNR